MHAKNTLTGVRDHKEELADVCMTGKLQVYKLPDVEFAYWQGECCVSSVGCFGKGPSAGADRRVAMGHSVCRAFHEGVNLARGAMDRAL